MYPNSGEHYDAVSKTWHHHGEHCAQLADYLPQWQAAGARLIGGCCRTTPADIAAAVLFLCGPESAFITGQVLVVDGGMTKTMIYHGDEGWTYQP